MRKPILFRALFPLVAALTALSIMGCMTDSDKGPNRTVANGVYNNYDIGLKIVYPRTWEALVDQIHENTKIDLVLRDAPRNGFRPNLTVIHTPHSGPTLMSEVLSMLKSEIQPQYADFSQYQDSIININDKEVGRMDFEASVNGILFHFRAMLFVNNGRDVAVTITDRADDFAVNAEVQALFDGVSITPK
jgi:hypothetical protein